MNKTEAPSSTDSNFDSYFTPIVVDYNIKENSPSRPSDEVGDVRYLSNEAAERVLNKSAWTQEAHEEL